MKTLFSFLIVLTCSTVYGQYKCPAIIDIKYTGYVTVYDTVNGNAITTLNNDTANENFINLKILDETDSFFRASLSLEFTNEIKTGWIKKADYIGAYMRHEDYPVMDITLYKEKKATEDNRITIKDWATGFLTIQKCAGAWALVSVQHKGVTLNGWIETVNLCANAYTYCN